MRRPILLCGSSFTGFSFPSVPIGVQFTGCFNLDGKFPVTSRLCGMQSNDQHEHNPNGWQAILSTNQLLVRFVQTAKDRPKLALAFCWNLQSYRRKVFFPQNVDLLILFS